MEYKLNTGRPELQRTGCLVVAVHQGNSLSAAAKAIDEACGGAITRIVKRGDLGKKTGQTRLLLDLADVKATRVLLVRCGPDMNDRKFSGLIKTCCAIAKGCSATDALFYLADVKIAERDQRWQIRLAVEIIEDSSYRFTQLKSKPEATSPELRKITFGLADATKAELAEFKAALAEGEAIGKGKQFAKTLGNLPGNICTPSYLAEQGKALAEQYQKLTTRVLSEKQMQDLGMGSLLSVSAGSAEPAKLVIMTYSGGAKSSAPQVLVGKGITFDTGGISLKAGGAMDEMKFDMCGAASVFGTMTAVAELELPMNVVGIVAAAENMPGSKATKPGDIVTSMSGQTIEVLNTDAEGRLVLCDALTYAERFKPAAIIDIATLTGACVIALGRHATGLFTNQDSLAEELLAAGNLASDRAWQMPAWDDYQGQLDSNFADMANIGGREAGSITAACFLSRFTKKQRWAHLDIAGTAWHSGKSKGASGRPVPLLTQYLLDRCAAQGDA